MSTYLCTCKHCNRLESSCICGAKRGYFRCAVCERDVEATKAVWADAPGVSEPLHAACFTALEAVEDRAAIEPIPSQPLFEYDEKVRVPEGNLKAVVQIPIRLVIEVPVTPEDCDEKIKFSINDALSSVMVAYGAATFSMNPATGQIEAKNLRFDEIVGSMAEQERNRKERIERC